MMQIIDAQIHELGPNKAWDPKYGSDSSLVLACELAIAAMEAVGVDLALFNARPELCDFAVSHYGDRFGAYAVVDPRVADLDSVVAKVSDTPGLVALRAVPGHWQTAAPPEELRAGVFEPMFAAAEKHHVPLFCFIPGYPADLAPAAQAHPDLTLIVDHIGLPQQPTRRDPEPFERLPQLLSLAPFRNVAVKLCGVQTLSREHYPYPDIWPQLHKILDAFGPERIMWASDFTRLRFADGSTQRGPRENWFGLYSESLDYLLESTELSSGDKEMIFGGTVKRILGWPTSP